VENATALESVAFSRMEASDLEPVISLHRSAFWYSFNSRLGTKHVSLLYDVMIHDPNSLVVVARNQTALVGVVSATLDSEELRKKIIARLHFQQKLNLAMRLVLNPPLLWNFLQERATEKPVRFQDQNVPACLTVIAVHANCRHAGIGRALVNEVENFVKAKGQHAFHLFTRVDNAVSCEFYRRLGFIEIERRGRDIVFIKELTEVNAN
jgi:ribosomal protein S18 acetylase RimI-like enzyme